MKFLNKVKNLFKKKPSSEVETIPDDPNRPHFTPNFFEPVTIEDKYAASKDLGDFIKLIDKK
jgi:hypothetical protein